jgi:hypothetical protein
MKLTTEKMYLYLFSEGTVRYRVKQNSADSTTCHWTTLRHSGDGSLQLIQLRPRHMSFQICAHLNIRTNNARRKHLGNNRRVCAEMETLSSHYLPWTLAGFTLSSSLAIKCCTSMASDYYKPLYLSVCLYAYKHFENRRTKICKIWFWRILRISSNINFPLHRIVLTTVLMETDNRYVRKTVCITAVNVLNSFHAKSGESG